MVNNGQRNGQGWRAVWRNARIIAIPAGAGIMVLAELYGGLVDGVVMSCSGIGDRAHCRWASVVQEPAYVQSVVNSWWCLLGIALLCCYITHCRASVRSGARRQQ